MNEPRSEYLNPEGFRSFVTDLEAFVTRLRNSKDLSYTGLMKAAGWGADEIRGARISGVDLSGSDMLLFSEANADLRGAVFAAGGDLPRDCWLERPEFTALLDRHQAELAGRPAYAINRRGLVLDRQHVVICDGNRLVSFSQGGRQASAREFGQGNIILLSQIPPGTLHPSGTGSLLLVVEDGRTELVEYRIDRTGTLQFVPGDRRLSPDGRGIGAPPASGTLNEAAVIPRQLPPDGPGSPLDLVLLSSDYTLRHDRYSGLELISSGIVEEAAYGICATVRGGAFLAAGSDIRFYDPETRRSDLWHTPPEAVQEPASRITFWKDLAIIRYELGSVELVDAGNRQDARVISLIRDVASDPQCRPVVLRDELFWLWMHGDGRIVLETQDRQVVATNSLPFVRQARLHVAGHPSGNWIEITDKAGTFARLDPELNFIGGAVFSTVMTEVDDGYSIDGKLLNLYGDQVRTLPAPERQAAGKP